jgi:hypothetical protein
MPIKGLLPDTAQGSLLRIGKLKKGEPKTNGKIGRDSQHFRLQLEPHFEHLRAAWTKLYGSQPTKFEPVYMMEPTAEAALTFWNEEYDSAETLLHRCDGEFQCLWFDRNSGFYSKAKVKCAAPACHCRPHARMNILLPEFIKATGVLGFITVEFGSQEDIRTLLGQLTFVQSTLGTLRGVPFILGRSVRRTSAPEVKPDGTRTGKRMKVSRSLLYLTVTPEFTNAALLPALAGVTVNMDSEKALPPENSAPLAATGTGDVVAGSAVEVDRARLGTGTRDRRL